MLNAQHRLSVRHSPVSHFLDQRLVIWVTAIFVRAWKMVSVSVRYLLYQPMNEKIKTWTLRFPAKENPNMEKALFDEPIVLQYDVKANYRLISRKFSSMKFFSAERSLKQPKATRVCIRSINQSNRSISARFLFLFCSRVFTSRSYENRSKCGKQHWEDEETGQKWKKQRWVEMSQLFSFFWDCSIDPSSPYAWLKTFMS